MEFLQDFEDTAAGAGGVVVEFVEVGGEGEFKEAGAVEGVGCEVGEEGEEGASRDGGEVEVVGEEGAEGEGVRGVGGCEWGGDGERVL